MTTTPRLTSFRQLDEFLNKSGCPRDEQMIRNNQKYNQSSAQTA